MNSYPQSFRDAPIPEQDVSSPQRQALFSTSLAVLMSFALLSIPPASWAAIEVQSANISTAEGTTDFSWNHTVSAGSNLILIVGVAVRSASPNTAQGVTYNGTALTQVGSSIFSAHANISMWYLVNPDVGTFSVSVDLTANRSAVGGAMTFSGVDQSTPLGTEVTATGAPGDTLSTDVSSAAGELVLDVVCQRDGGTLGDATEGAGQTKQVDAVHSGTSMRLLASTEDGAATVTMSWTFTLDPEFSQIAVPLKPAAGWPASGLS